MRMEEVDTRPRIKDIHHSKSIMIIVVVLACRRAEEVRRQTGEVCHKAREAQCKDRLQVTESGEASAAAEAMAMALQWEEEVALQHLIVRRLLIQDVS